MFETFFKKTPPLPHEGNADTRFVYEIGLQSKPEMRETEQVFARVFASQDGKKVLSHLQVMTFHRALGGSAAEQELRYIEGQRALVASILRMIERGRGR